MPPRGEGVKPVRWRLRVLGAISVLVFFVPLVAPFVQGLTLWETLHAAWRGQSDQLSVTLGALGAVLGFALFLATEFVWVI